MFWIVPWARNVNQNEDVLVECPIRLLTTFRAVGWCLTPCTHAKWCCVGTIGQGAFKARANRLFLCRWIHRLERSLCIQRRHVLIYRIGFITTELCHLRLTWFSWEDEYCGDVWWQLGCVIYIILIDCSSVLGNYVRFRPVPRPTSVLLVQMATKTHVLVHKLLRSIHKKFRIFFW